MGEDRHVEQVMKSMAARIDTEEARWETGLMTPEEAGRMIAELRLAGYLLPTRREIPGGRMLDLEDEFIVGAATGDERVAVLAAMRAHTHGTESA